MHLGWKFILFICWTIVSEPYVQSRAIENHDHESANRSSRARLPVWLLSLLQQGTAEEKVTKRGSEPQALGELSTKGRQFGQISGVAVDHNGNPVLFHRGNTVWDTSSFGFDGKYRKAYEGPIEEDTIVTLDGQTGDVLRSWGSGLFYMPHGLTIDSNGNTWVTDVALHQVMKFANGSKTPDLVLGEASVPGNDDAHFCKPTDVAVASNGVFFVADGYCNSRILKYSPRGELIDKIEGQVQFNVPHSLALFEEEDKLCVADRENQRIVCTGAGLHSIPLGQHATSTRSSSLGRVFAIAPLGQNILSVTGPSILGRFGLGPSASGYTVDLNSNEIVGKWVPPEGFGNPHDVAAASNGVVYVVEIGPNRVSKFVFPVQ